MLGEVITIIIIIIISSSSRLWLSVISAEIPRIAYHIIILAYEFNYIYNFYGVYV